MPLKQTAKHAALKVFSAVQAVRNGSPPKVSEIRSFLFLQYASALGAAVHATPVFSALRAAVPDAEIVVCASGFSLEVLHGNPAIDRLVETPNPTRYLVASARAIAAALPQRRPFATITTTANERTAIPLASSLAGAGNFFGFTLLAQLFRAPLVYDKSMSQIANNLRIVGALGHPVSHFEPEVFFSSEDRLHAKGLVGRFDSPSRPLAVLVSQTSVTQKKGWRSERFVAAANHLIQRHEMNVLLLGAPAERKAVGELALTIGDRARNVAGETSISQLAALLSCASVGLTLDTGILHIGRAVGLPMVVIAPAWSPPAEWLPLDDPRYAILKNLDFATCPADYIIDEVSVEEVTASLDRLLWRFPAKPVS